MKGNDKYDGMYMWVHQLFVDSCESDKKFNDIFQSWEKIDVTCGQGLDNPRDRGRGAHYFVPYDRYMNEPLTEESKKRIDDKVDYVYKLNYRQGIDWRSNTTLQYLIKSIDIEINFE